MKLTKTQIIKIATAVFAAAAALGSTILTPAQRETILAFIAAIL